MKDLKKMDEAGSSELVSKEELKLLIESLDKPVLYKLLVDLLYKLNLKSMEKLRKGK
ncbi:hypothetical protein L195_g016996 [Trifolium pratense]|uniref:Uncharacterized protein n=1 Tax=Trifolium pratense TaxID=57577 RepID=A0A2K3MSY9_TRIPR|nr:hypothetical protein L195_g016996 [Trifolium pratense]